MKNVTIILLMLLLTLSLTACGNTDNSNSLSEIEAQEKEIETVTPIEMSLSDMIAHYDSETADFIVDYAGNTYKVTDCYVLSVEYSETLEKLYGEYSYRVFFNPVPKNEYWNGSRLSAYMTEADANKIEEGDKVTVIGTFDENIAGKGFPSLLNAYLDK